MPPLKLEIRQEIKNCSRKCDCSIFSINEWIDIQAVIKRYTFFLYQLRYIVVAVELLVKQFLQRSPATIPIFAAKQ